MISDQVPKLTIDQFDRPSNVHGKTGPKKNTQDNCQIIEVRIYQINTKNTKQNKAIEIPIILYDNYFHNETLK